MDCTVGHILNPNEFPRRKVKKKKKNCSPHVKHTTKNHNRSKKIACRFS